MSDADTLKYLTAAAVVMGGVIGVGFIYIQVLWNWGAKTDGDLRVANSEIKALDHKFGNLHAQYHGLKDEMKRAWETRGNDLQADASLAALLRKVADHLAGDESDE